MSRPRRKWQVKALKARASLKKVRQDRDALARTLRSVAGILNLVLRSLPDHPETPDIQWEVEQAFRLLEELGYEQRSRR